MTGFGGASQRPLMRDLAALPDASCALKAARVRARHGEPDERAARRSARCATLGGGECAARVRRARCAAGRAAAPLRRALHDRPLAGLRRSGAENEHYAPGRLRRRARRGAPSRVRRHRRAGPVLQIDAPDLAMERHTLFADRPLDEFLAFVDARRRGAQPRARELPRRAGAAPCVLGQLRGAAPVRRPRSRSPARLYRARVGALVLSMANPRHAHEHRVLARHRCRPAGSWSRGHRPDHQLRRASRGRGRAPRAAAHAVATRAACSRARTAASTPRRGSARWPRRSCGRSSAHSARGADLASKRLLIARHGMLRPCRPSRTSRFAATICSRSRFTEQPPAELAPGQVLLKIDAFAFTANNVTYAVFGDMMRYWQFFPAASEGWGRIPGLGIRRRDGDANNPDVAVGSACTATSRCRRTLSCGPRHVGRAASSTHSPQVRCPRSTTVIAAPAPTRATRRAPRTGRVLMQPLFMTAFPARGLLADEAFLGARDKSCSRARRARPQSGLAALLLDARR